MEPETTHATGCSFESQLVARIPPDVNRVAGSKRLVQTRHLRHNRRAIAQTRMHLNYISKEGRMQNKSGPRPIRLSHTSNPSRLRPHANPINPIDRTQK